MLNKDGLRSKGNKILNRTGRGHYLKIGFLSLFILIILAYNIIFIPSVFEKIIKNQFEKRSNGKINLHVAKSSLLRGFSIENLEILSGPDFNNKPLFKIDKLNFLYSVYGFFAGDFGFHEIGFYNPVVYLYHKDGIWNSSTLMKKSENVVEEEKKPETETKSSPGFSLPVQVRGFIKIVLQNFTLTVTDLNPGGKDTFEAGLRDFTLRTYIITKKFSYVPYSLAATDLFKSIIVNLDPQKTIDIYFKNQNTRLKSPLDLHWLLTFDNNIKKEGFYSKLIVGHQNIPVEYKGKHILPLNFGMDYDIRYDPDSDIMDLKYFRLSFLDNIWMNLNGMVQKPADSSKTKFFLKITNSDIDIGKIFPYYQAFTKSNDLEFKGNISLAPLSISGPLNNLLLDGKLSFYKLNVNMGSKNINFSYFDLYYNTIVDKNLEKSLIPKVREAKIRWEGNFNKAPLGAEIAYKINENINISAYIKKFNPEPFSSDKVSGLFNVDIHVKGKTEKNLTSTLEVSSPYFTYYIDRGISGINQLDFYLKSNILFNGEGYDSLQLNAPEITFRLRNEKNRKAFSLNAAMDMTKNSDGMNVKFNIADMTVNIKNLKSTLPEVYQEKVESLADKSEKDIRINGLTVYQKNGEQMQTENKTRFYVDDLDIDDVVFKTKIIQNADMISIPNMTLTGLNDALDASLKGSLTHEYRNIEAESKQGIVKEEKQLTWIPDVKYSFKLGKGAKTRIFKGQTLEGFFDLTGNAKDFLINGNLLVNKLYYDNGNFTRVNNMNINFPFSHDRHFKKKLNLTAANKERLIKNFGGDFKFNFTIDSIEIPNPSRIKEPLKIIYPGGEFSGLSAALRYKDNVFEMPMMQIFMLNGLMTIQDTIFNVGTGKSSQMEYRALMKIKDIDLKQLIPIDKAASIKDGKISADALLTASSLKNILADTSGYVSIYKIGRQFANQGVKIVMPDSSPLISLIVDEWTIVHKFDFEIKEGLAYIKILYTKGLVGNLFGLEGNEIAQERRPIAELFQKAGEEVKIYQSNGSKSENTENNE